MNSYKAINNQRVTLGKYSIVPIRFEDRFSILKWRNEQMYHLRQEEIISKDQQEDYFNNVVKKLFDKEKPEQLLFSYLYKGNCIGYGGLVHINWPESHAEISFIMNTEFENDFFDFHWSMFLVLIEKIAFLELSFNKIFTYAFDLRPHLYETLIKNGFSEEAKLREQTFYKQKPLDVLIHSKSKEKLILRPATKSDEQITFKWAKDKTIRKYAFQQNEIERKEHQNWFKNQHKEQCLYLILMDESLCVGSIRFNLLKDNTALISYLVDPNFHGKGYGQKILEKGIFYLKRINKEIHSIHGFVMHENIPSCKIFDKLNFKKQEQKESIKYVLSL